MKKLFTITLFVMFSLISLVWLTSNQSGNVTEAQDKFTNEELNYRDGGQRVLYSPSLPGYAPVVDKTFEFAEISKRNTLSKTSKKAYLENRKGQIKFNPHISDMERDQQLDKIDQIMLRSGVPAAGVEDSQKTLSGRNESLTDSTPEKECYGTVAHGVILEAAPRVNFNWSTVFDGRVTEFVSNVVEMIS